MVHFRAWTHCKPDAASSLKTNGTAFGKLFETLCNRCNKKCHTEKKWKKKCLRLNGSSIRRIQRLPMRPDPYKSSKIRPEFQAISTSKTPGRVKRWPLFDVMYPSISQQSGYKMKVYETIQDFNWNPGKGRHKQYVLKSILKHSNLKWLKVIKHALLSRCEDQNRKKDAIYVEVFWIGKTRCND